MNFLLPSGWPPRVGGLLLLLALYLPAWAQVDTYTLVASTGTFVPLPATATAVPVLLADDAISSTIALPFPFTFDGTTQNAVRVSSNGFVSFSTAAGSARNNDLAHTTAFGSATEYPLVAPFWDDLDGRDATAQASYLTSGTGANQVFTFEWLNWKYLGGSGPSFSMQVKLYQTSNRVEFIYRQESAALGGATASVGLAGDLLGPTQPASSFLSLQDVSATPVSSSSTENKSISSLPATGQIYAFTPAPVTGCLPPRALGISDVTGNSATVDFRAGAATTTFTVTYQAAGGPVQTVPGSFPSGPIFLVGLSLNTTYTVTVTASCAGGLTSAQTVTFTTSNGYCSGGGGSCGSNNITQVAIATTTLNANNLTCASTAGQAYTNYPAVAPTSGTLLRGVSYNISAATGSTASIVGAWIDLDHDFVFSPTEFVQLYNGTTSGSAVFAVPTGPTGATNTYLGPTGMRVRSVSTFSTLAASSACANFFSGETKDFTVVLGAPPTCIPPSGLAAINITTTDAQLSFVSGSTGGSYTIVYGPTGFNLNGGAGGTPLTNTFSPTGLSGLTPGTSYDFYVRRDCGNGDLSVFTGPFTFTTRITNVNPCTATVLPVNQGCVPLYSTTVGASPISGSGIITTTCPGFNTNPSAVWFSFTTGAVGSPVATNVRLSVTGSAASVVQVFQATSCNGPFTNIRCQGTGTNTPAGDLDLQALTPNTTYFVRVFGYSGTSPLGPFSICAAPIPNCSEPVALNADNITSSAAHLTWASQTSSTTTFLVKYGPGPFNPQTAGTAVGPLTAQNVVLTSLAPASNYCFYVQRNCGGFNGSSLWSGPYCFSTLAPAPANDEPCGAFPLPAGTATSISGTNVGATTSTQAGVNVNSCSSARQPSDVWYTMTPAAGSTSVTVTLQGPAAGALRVFSSPDCANGVFNQEFCRAASAPNMGFSGQAFTITGLTPGARYYVSVAGLTSADATGPFTLALGPLGPLGARVARATNALLVYPNPSNTGQLTLRLGQAGAGEAALLNALGQTVWVKPIAGDKPEQVLNTHGLANGVYTLRVRLGAEVLTRKVVLE